MLVLSRKPGQSIVIADNVRLIVQRVRGNNVTLAIDAPDSVRVLRGELLDRAGQQPEEPPRPAA